MTCYRMPIGDDVATICIRSSRKKPNPCPCGFEATELCDFPTGKRKTCSALLCEKCRIQRDNKDYCPAHASAAVISQPVATHPADHRIRGLTLWRPWPWSIAYGSKRIENRTWWRTSAKGLWVALHAGVEWDLAGAQRIAATHPEMPSREVDHPIGIVAVARVIDVVTSSVDPWFTGPYGWQLDEITPIDPIRCKGSQRLWLLSEEVLMAIRERYNAARRSVDDRAPDRTKSTAARGSQLAMAFPETSGRP